jgi:Septum formation
MAEPVFEHQAAVRAALHAIVSDPAYGPAALSSASMMSSLLKDLLPDAPRESGLLIAAAQAGVADSIRQHISQGLDAATAVTLAARSLGDSTAFAPDACSWAARELAIAQGIASPIQPPAEAAVTPAGVPADLPGSFAGQATMAPSAGPEIAGVAAGPASAEPTAHEAPTVQPAGSPAPTELAQPAGLESPAPGRPPSPRRRVLFAMLSCFVVLAVIVVVVLIEADKTPGGKPVSLSQLKLGECLVSSASISQLSSLYLVPCRDEHAAQVVLNDSRFWPASQSWPGGHAIIRLAGNGCSHALASYSGLPASQMTYGYIYINPSSASQWKSGDRSLLCIVYKPTTSDPGGASFRGSLKNSA